MKYLAKFVVVIVLVALTGLPAFAAIPCQDSANYLPCCHGTMCPLMAKMAGNREIGHRGMNDAPAPCCKIHSISIVAVTDHQAIETPALFADFGVGSDALSIHLVKFRHEDVTLVNLRSGRSTQALLSTFLI